MASLSTSADGSRRILFVDAAGNRKTIHLGRMPKRQAESVKVYVEALASSQRTGIAPDGEVSTWLARIGTDLAEKLARAGLVARRGQAQAPTLGEFVDQYVRLRADLKPQTAAHFGHLKRFLLGCFGDAFPLREMTEASVEEFRVYLSQRLALNTVRRHLGRARQLFRHAVRAKLIDQNPFDSVRGVSTRSNRDRVAFVRQETIDQLLDSLACPQLRLVVALARYAGLRIPSEALALRWCDVNVERQRLTVYAAKKEHLGQATRIVPIHPKLAPLLTDAFFAAKRREVYVITRFRERGGALNLRTALTRALDRAGLPRWPKLFVNLRSSYATELIREHPRHVATAILGHSEAIAEEHYWQVGDEDLDRVIEGARNPTQSAPEIARNGPNTVQGEGGETLDFSGDCELVRDSVQTNTYPAWIRTRNEGTKVPSVTSYTTG